MALRICTPVLFASDYDARDTSLPELPEGARLGGSSCGALALALFAPDADAVFADEQGSGAGLARALSRSLSVFAAQWRVSDPDLRWPI